MRTGNHKRDINAVRCPVCRAHRGKPCVTEKRRTPRSAPHSARIDRWKLTRWVKRELANLAATHRGKGSEERQGRFYENHPKRKTT